MSNERFTEVIEMKTNDVLATIKYVYEQNGSVSLQFINERFENICGAISMGYYISTVSNAIVDQLYEKVIIDREDACNKYHSY